MSENEWERMIPDQLSILQQGAVFLCDRMSIAKTPLAKILTPQLSETEVKILRLASAGLPVDEIGQRTNLSDRMVSIYLKSCRTKLSALTTPQAIGRAIMKKIIDPV
jgi:DNA-binding CsgD family transcriptional regulator